MITVHSLSRAQGTPVYPGHMEITEENDGLLLLNEVDLEEYLKRVTPSEIPGFYRHCLSCRNGFRLCVLLISIL